MALLKSIGRVGTPFLIVNIIVDLPIQGRGSLRGELRRWLGWSLRKRYRLWLLDRRQSWMFLVFDLGWLRRDLV